MMALMRTIANVRSCGALLALAALAACGGGGSSIPSGQPSQGQPAAGSAPTPGTTPAAASRTTGAVYACTWTGSSCSKGAPIGGASVAVGSSLAGGTLGGIAAQATTAADGSYVLNAVPASARYLQVSVAGNPVVLHAAVTPGSGTFPDVLLSTPTADEIAGFNQINADRAAHGTGSGANPLALDEYLLETARYRANDMATFGYFSHDPPSGAGLSGWNEYQLLAKGLPYSGWGENIALGFSSLTAAENAYISEGPTGGHYDNIVNASNVWTGLAAVYNGKALPPYTPNYSAEEFAQM